MTTRAVNTDLLDRVARALYYVSENGAHTLFFRVRYSILADEVAEVIQKVKQK